MTDHTPEQPTEQLTPLPEGEWYPPDEWDDDSLASLHDDSEPPMSSELVLRHYTQTEWDRRKVHQLGQVEKVLHYWSTHPRQQDAELITRGAIILRAEPDAHHVERNLGVRTDPAGLAAYLALPSTASPVAAPVKVPASDCPVCGRTYVRLRRHLKTKHPDYVAATP